MSLLEVRDLQKVYTSRGGNRTAALRGVSFAVEEGEFVAVMGESGSGTCTLLNLLASLDRPTGGAGAGKHPGAAAFRLPPGPPGVYLPGPLPAGYLLPGG